MNFPSSHKFDNKSKYVAQDRVISVMGSTKKSPFYSIKRRNDAQWEQSYNDATALYRYLLVKDNYNYDIILTPNGTCYDELVDIFMSNNPDKNEGFNVGKSHAIRVIRLKDKNINLEYLGDYDELSIIDNFERFLDDIKYSLVENDNMANMLERWGLLTSKEKKGGR